MAAIDRQTGDLLWSTRVDSHSAAKITSSPIVVGKQVIVGVSSWEEELAVNSSAAQFGGSPTAPYPCCSFRGSVASLDLVDGHVNEEGRAMRAQPDRPARFPAPELPAGLTCENLNEQVGNHLDSVGARPSDRPHPLGFPRPCP